MDEKIVAGSEFFWFPSREIQEKTHLSRFIRQNDLEDLHELLQRSTDDVAWFTQALLEYLDIQFFTPYEKVVDLSDGIAWPKWCVGGKLNIVHNCLDKYIGTPVEARTALAWESENGQTRQLTYRELYEQVNQAANGLRSLGLGKGDAVGLFMPMVPEIVVALLAIAKIGGVILPLFSGYGPGALVTRLIDANAKAIFTADGFYRRGKPVAMKPVVDEAAAQASNIQHVIVLGYSGIPFDLVEGRDHTWDQLVEDQPTTAETEITGAEDSLMILYTSGTTGRPKGAVHTHCGFPVKAAQDMAFGTDVHPGQVIYWITDMGWMMGPWETFGTLILGATFFLYDGAPDYPAPDRLWSMIERHRITTVGISPTLIRALIPHGDAQFASHDLSHLKLFALTGEPCNPEPWRWLFDRVGKGAGADHQLYRRDGNFWRDPDEQPAPADETLFFQFPMPGDRRGCIQRTWAADPRRGGRTGD